MVVHNAGVGVRACFTLSDLKWVLKMLEFRCVIVKYRMSGKERKREREREGEREREKERERDKKI